MTYNPWIEHNGGPCPIPDAKEGEFEVDLRDGFTLCGFPGEFDWLHHGDEDDHVIAYRLIEPKQADLDWLEGELGEARKDIGSELGSGYLDEHSYPYWKGKEDMINHFFALIKSRREGQG